MQKIHRVQLLMWRFLAIAFHRVFYVTFSFFTATQVEKY